MKNKLLVIGAVLIPVIMVMPAFSSVFGGTAPPTPSDTLRKALLQIRNEFEDLLPSGTWGGWDGSTSGLSSGSSGGTPTLTFDSCTIALPPDNSGTAAPTSAGVAVPQPPYSPSGQVNISINTSYVDSNLARMKVVLFHELVHVSQWRDTSGEWDPEGGSFKWNWTKDKNLTGLKEIQASGLSLKFIQKLMKKKEFQTKSMRDEFKREMQNLQARLKKAGWDRTNISDSDWGRDLLRKWFPRDLILLILMKKAIFYSWANPSVIKPEEYAHIMEVAETAEDFDAYDDDLIYGDPYGRIFAEGLKEAKDEKEFHGQLLGNAVQSYFRGEFGAAINQANAYINHLEAQRDKLGDEVCDKALEYVHHILDYITVVDVIPPQPEIINPLDGMIIGRWAIVEAVELTGADDVVSTDFMISADGVVWTEILSDVDPTDGWWIEFDTHAFPNGPYFIMATMTDLAGNAGSDEVSILIDNI
jgi:hypothetical protein